MTERVIEPGSLLHGLLNSDFDGWLLLRYDELLRAFEGVFNNGTSEENQRFISMLTDTIKRTIADNNRIIRELEIILASEFTEEGFISLNRIKYNNILSINEKAECLIRDLERFKSIDGKPKRENQLTNDIIGLFCHLVLEAGQIPQEDRETAENYCKRVCTKYHLRYTVKVSKALYRCDIDKKHQEKLMRLILPAVDVKTRDAIIKFLETNNLNRKKSLSF